MGTITIYSVSEEQLQLIEAGAPFSTYLNFAIALLTTALNFTTTLFLTRIDSDRLFMAFLLVTLVSVVSGSVLLSLWWRVWRTSRTIFQSIRSRDVAAQGTLVEERL